MKKTLAALSLAAGIGLLCSQSVNAVPASGTGVGDALVAASTLQQAQFAEHRTRRGLVKCYRYLLIGPYRCHYYPNPL